MPVANLKNYIEEADRNGRAIGCFNIYNIETVCAVIDAAESTESPVCVSFHPPHFKYSDIEVVAAATLKAAQKASVPVIIHLDNAQDMALIKDAIKWGFTSVMFIANSQISFEEKIRLTKEAADIAHSAEVMIESDIGPGPVPGKKFDSNKEANDYYLENAASFVESTAIDIVSADIVRSLEESGQKKTYIDIDLLTALRKRTGKFISLHGGSGVPDQILQQAIKAGLNKMHIFAKAANNSIADMKSSLDAGQKDIIELLNIQKKGYMEVVLECLRLFGTAKTAAATETICDKRLKELIVENLTRILLEQGIVKSTKI